MQPQQALAALWLSTCSDRLLRLHATVATCLVGVPVLVFSMFAAWFGLTYLWPLAALTLLWLTWRVARREEPDVPLVAAMCAVLLSALLGLVYPSLGINQLPDELPADLATAEVRIFARPQPGMLSMRLGRSVQPFAPPADQLAARLKAYDGYLFALDSDAAVLGAAARSAGVELERVQEFRSFYSRKAWLKFFKQGLDGDDWQEALWTRSAEGLKPTFVCFRVR